MGDKIKKLIGIISFMCVTAILFCQIEWTKFSNPVLTKSTSSKGWDFIAIGQPTCLVDNNIFKMWYVGAGIFNNKLISSIGYAYSFNGINWIKYGKNPILKVGPSGSWDQGWIDTPTVCKDKFGYKMWYLGMPSLETPPLNAKIGLAISSDGINWEKYSGNPVFSKGSENDWDGFWIESPSVIWDEEDGLYKMWYTGVDRNWRCRIGYAYSPDGINWTKYKDNPILDLGEEGSWEDLWVAVCSVNKRGKLYEMFYCGVSKTDMLDGRVDSPKIGLAISFDGVHWKKHPDNPILSDAWAPTVVLYESKYKIWYELSTGIYLAESKLRKVAKGRR
ncbi:hypothetical protein NLC26_03425 [Candidatus Aminicenantes bacterium AC-708-M15]|nr:hypothetical protein [SCandidatus Aminicenantes bacterium Aminicenantia_JdfR_composite]MCP2596337.1 hypothetical protein [Candidatus Aminicenantes bacterium AC-335-G13]MCP2598775.1 hypothetical protein [Candidatus Aminicenantes bacterium AC-335-L06]MCP2604515.1 hypothetical protein [Candidatus Aminicenantes bacterium AC-708-M15]MCP2605422.1 hypothetical protein [Candidatus Aminicenantes bacterium AC-335-O07]MCP2617812.1 hypothetical protein [Candidatus Aminicenantes bacterium AC-335-A11]